MLVDLLAHQSTWRFIHPGEKMVLFLVLALWGFSPVPIVQLGLLGIFPWLFHYSGVPWRFLLKLLRAPLFFILSGVLIVVFASSGGIQDGIRLALRSMVVWNAFLLLASTTPIPDLLEFLSRFSVLRVFTEVALLTYRYLFVFSEKAEEMYRAQQARLGYGSYRGSLRSLALLVTGLLLYTFQTVERFRLALEARVFEGEFRVLSLGFLPVSVKRLSLFAGVGWSAVLMMLWGKIG